MFRLAIPNKGALSEKAVGFLVAAGYKCQRKSRELVVRDAEHGVEFIYLRPRDVAIYVGNGLIGAGITGRDLAVDSGANVHEVLPLGFGKSRFCYAAPKGEGLTPDALGGKRIATSYPRIVRQDLKERGLEGEVIRLDGAVEISIQLGVADAIADVVESGRTLVEAGLEIIGEPLMKSEACLYAGEVGQTAPELKQLVQRLEGILVARDYVLLEYAAPVTQQEAACALTPGVKAPTLSPMSDENWVAIAAMVRVKGLNKIIDELATLGCKGIIAHEIKTCRL